MRHESIDPATRIGALLRCTVEGDADFTVQLIQRADEADGHHALDGLPDEFDRVEVWRVGRQKHQFEPQLGGRLANGVGVMATEVVEHDDDRPRRGVGSPDLAEERGDRRLAGIAQRVLDAVADDGVETDRIGFQTGGVLDDLAMAEVPHARGVGVESRAGFVEEADGDVGVGKPLATQACVGALESLFEMRLGIRGALGVRGVGLTEVHAELLTQDATDLTDREFDAELLTDEPTDVAGLPERTLVQQGPQPSQIAGVERRWAPRVTAGLGRVAKPRIAALAPRPNPQRDRLLRNVDHGAELREGQRAW